MEYMAQKMDDLISRGIIAHEERELDRLKRLRDCCERLTKKYDEFFPNFPVDMTEEIAAIDTIFGEWEE